MLAINWEDVIRLLDSLKTQLVVIGIVLALAIIITIAVFKMKTRTRKFVRSTTWIAALLAVIVAVMTMLYGGLKTPLDLASGSGALTQETMDEVKSLNEAMSDEGMVLLKNQNGTLPLSKGSALNTFGWASTNPVYGGTGSGSMRTDVQLASLLNGLENAGFSVNNDLVNFYTDYAAERPVAGMFSDTDISLPEPPADSYTDELLNSVRDFSDTAIVTISRSGGEGYDFPSDMNATVAAKNQYQYKENSKDYKDFADGQGYLSLTQSEKDMIEVAKANSDKVVVLYNGGNVFELDELAKDPEIDAILWTVLPGQVGFNSLGRILNGDVNPSAKTPDTFVKDLNNTPTSKNFGVFTYTNMDEHVYEMQWSGDTYHPTFSNYVEGIYVGYRFWETAAEEGLINYDEWVTYPFGYGLSYTTFQQTMSAPVLDPATGEITVDVTVTNTGSAAGKDVVQLYSNPPYTNGGIEKASANLVAYDKTQILDPGASQTLTLTLNREDLASYDYTNAKAYVLEAGDYGLSIRANSHEILQEQTLNIPATITYSAQTTHNGDKTAATNRFDYARGDFTLLSRADGFANFDEATAAPTNFELSDERKAQFVDNTNYDPAEHNDEADEMPTTGAKNGIELADMYGLDYDDPKWEQLLDQLSVNDMDQLIANGGYQTPAVSSIAKVQNVDVDGPAALNNNFTGVGSIGMAASVSLAASFNTDLATQYGEMIAKMGKEMQVSGWYAPAVNTHRSAYAGRNFEYYSEDPFLTGETAAHQAAAVQAEGIYVFMKHFALNDQETYRMSKLTTWADEQTMREIYLKPFESLVKDGGATAVMSAYNFIGPVYAGATPGLLQGVLRDEWGFQGMVLTDYFADFGYQNADQIIRAGGDTMLASLNLDSNHVHDRSATSVIAMRTAAHNILYTTANSWIYADGTPASPMLLWEWIAWGVALLLTAGAVVLFVVALRRFIARGRDEVTVTVEPADTATGETPSDSDEEASHPTSITE
ncbi:glycoside hydrolase family 3 C-terminal domain-containing protein [Schaalia sp. ZJ1691]|uniref:glycoside hydrolase family 3 C-terminal domain-containing protein n=1 Tax=Schaalia sp. ZJ1691 TaxID=2709404 RepID=UPI0013ECBF10|nr:glycoside hydrolase family 3 C-terminal domain-containing protein [Schaalia sp. ZJ1691]